jgi:hypothetical protein
VTYGVESEAVANARFKLTGVAGQQSHVVAAIFNAVSILPAGTFWVPVVSRVLRSVSVVIATLNGFAPFSFTNTSTVPIV